jgi:hypothetical protein
VRILKPLKTIPLAVIGSHNTSVGVTVWYYTSSLNVTPMGE